MVITVFENSGEYSWPGYKNFWKFRKKFMIPYIFSGVQYFYIRQSFGLNWHEVSLSDCDVYRFQLVLLGEVLLPEKKVDAS